MEVRRADDRRSYFSDTKVVVRGDRIPCEPADPAEPPQGYHRVSKVAWPPRLRKVPGPPIVGGVALPIL